MKVIDLIGGDSSLLISEKWTKKYKKSIDCSNPKGFSQKAHCAARKKRQRHQKTKSKSINENSRILIQELFSPNYVPPEKSQYWEVIKSELNLMVYAFEVDSQEYNVMCYRITGTGVWRIEFGIQKNTWISYDLENHLDPKTSLKVFGLVWFSLKHLLKHGENVKGIYFTADEPKRIKLYSTMISTVSRQMGWKLRPDLAKEIEIYITSEKQFLAVEPSYEKELEDFFNKRNEGLSESNTIESSTVNKKQVKGTNYKMKIMDLLQEQEEFLTEAEGAALVIVDIDDTLMHTTARIGLVKKDETEPYKYISSAEFNSYKPREGETFDFGEFRSAKKFHDESKPIRGVWSTVKRTQENLKRRPGSLMAVVTARAEFDNQELFKQTFKEHGLDISKIIFYTVGGSKNKKPLIYKLLNDGNFVETTMFDDHPQNIRDFLSLHEEFPDVTFKGFLIDPEHGRVSNNAVVLPASSKDKTNQDEQK